MKSQITALVLASLSFVCAAQSGPQIDAAFPGGNIIVEKLHGDDVYLRQDLRDTSGDWFYWHFRVREAAGRRLLFHFTKGNPIGVRGPAVSDDGGRNWRWLGKQAVRGATFEYSFTNAAEDVRFCFAFPYVEANLHTFLQRHETNPAMRVGSLCKTPKGRNAELLLIGQPDEGCANRIAITCRHHCCEMMASYVLEGIIDAILADTDDGRWLRSNAAFFIVPFVDKDGVEDGDQGKNRKPRDHNRDYGGEGLYATTRAIRERLPEWAGGKLRIAFDLHCPFISGARNESIYFVGGRDARIWDEVGRFSSILESVRTGPLVFRSSDNLPFGKDWNTEANYGGNVSFARWAAQQPGIAFATTLETAYANANGGEVTDESTRALGRDLAAALRKYLSAP